MLTRSGHGEAAPAAVRVVLEKRVDADCPYPLMGCYTCRHDGQLTLLLDNEYSFWTSKEVLCSVLVTPPPQQHKAESAAGGSAHQ